MSGDVLLIYGEDFMRYRLSESHPLQPIRVKLTFELITQLGLLEACELLPPRMATDDELRLVHDDGYIRLVRELSDPSTRGGVDPLLGIQHGLGTPDDPVADGMHEGCAFIAGASVVAAEAIHAGRALHAFNPAGGLHHAHRGKASGFCIYNDASIAIAWLRAKGHRVAYIDVDVHHGDGVQHTFEGDPDVLTISLHESGRYLFPGTGFPEEIGTGAGTGCVVNMPFPPHTWNRPWLEAFESVVPTMLRRFKPDILVTQDGCDTHVLDPLAHLRMSTDVWPVIGGRFHQLAHELCGGRWLALGGGGYAVREVVPRAWTLLFAEMVEKPELASHLRDGRDFEPELPTADAVRAFISRDLRTLGDAHGLSL